MMIPIVNAIFDGKLNIEEFTNKLSINNLTNLSFKKAPQKIFPIIK